MQLNFIVTQFGHTAACICIELLCNHVYVVVIARGKDLRQNKI